MSTRWKPTLGITLALLLAPSAAFGQTSAPGPVLESGHTQPGPVWSYSGPYWRPVDVCLGNRGTQVFAGIWHSPWQEVHAQLFSSHDSAAAAPVWESAIGFEQALMADSAELTDVHAVFTHEETGVLNERIHRVRKYSSQGLDWVYTHPQVAAGLTAVGVSRSGDRIVATCHNPAADQWDVLVFGPDSPVPVDTFGVEGTPWHFDLSAKGTHAAFACGTAVRVLDLADGAVRTLVDTGAYVATRDVAVSGDGAVVACFVTGGLAIYEWDGAGYTRTWLRSVTGSGFVDVSHDGSRVAYGFNFGYGTPRIVIECVDVATKSITMSDDVTNVGQYSNRVADVSITGNGALFAVATAGDELGLEPELRVYDPHQNKPVRALDLPGSAVAVDISADRLWVAVGSYPVHEDLPSNGGRIDLFHLGRADFAMHNVPSLGSMVEFELFGRPGRKAYLLDSPLLAKPPLPFPGFGTLRLDPAALTMTPMGSIGPDGSQTLDRVLPSDPMLVGVAHYFQGFTNDPLRRLSRNWLVVTLLP